MDVQHLDPQQVLIFHRLYNNDTSVKDTQRLSLSLSYCIFSKYANNS
jgi:hypothetical protein